MNLKNLLFILISSLSIAGNIAHAQDKDLLQVLNDSIAANKSVVYTTGTFKATHIVNMQTIEAPAPGSLSFVIQHRFGQLNSGANNFFGLDNATLRLSLDYGVTDWLAIGIGRSSYEKLFDGSLKFKLIRQTDSISAHKMPISVSLFTAINTFTQDYTDQPYLTANLRTRYVAQILLARKFNKILSLQIAPTYLHYNLVPTTQDKNDEFALGTGGRIKITKRMSLNAEYNYLFHNQINSSVVHNSFSLGWDIETGGHVFQLVFSNSQGMTETQYIGRTPGKWGDGDIFFGFNISRNFNITKHSKKTAEY